MNADNKNIHSSTDESLEVFSPYPAYHESKTEKHNIWLKFLRELIKTKH